VDASLTLAAVELLVAPSERKVQPVAPEEATLTLKKFADIPWVSFGDVPPGTSAVSSLHIVNPSKAEVHLTLERFPADKGEVPPCRLACISSQPSCTANRRTTCCACCRLCGRRFD
jgi:hypothetical protein